MRALLLQAFYPVRSERQLMERMEGRHPITLTAAAYNLVRLPKLLAATLGWAS